MAFQKRGGSMNYDWQGPETPTAITRYTVGGRSVHDAAVSSGLSAGTVRDTRQHSKRSQPGEVYKAAPFVINRNKKLTRAVED